MKHMYTGLFLFVITFSFGQLNLMVNSNAQTLSQTLAGPGVTIMNVTKNCDNNASGTFTNGNATDLGLNNGVVLASGRVADIPQDANNFASTTFTNTGDAQLQTLTAGTIYDKCVLEFDIVPQGTVLSFNYVFASEEYPEFVCSPYNDVFGFFITGPNPAGGNYASQNIALIPNSILPVAINTVNGGTSGTYAGTTWNPNNCQSLSNTSYYRDNLNPVNPNIVYDGMTTVLTATINVNPCDTYHLKLAIADVADRLYDSGVFLEASSITSNTPNPLTVTSQISQTGYTSTYEGCVGGSFTICMQNTQVTDLTVNLSVTGTATNGTDYNTIPNSIIIPAGQTCVTIPFNPVQDGIVESVEIATVSVLGQCAGITLSGASLAIADVPAVSVTAADSILCSGQATQLTATGGVSYQWSPIAGLSDPNIANPVATPTATTTYVCTVTWGNCAQTDSVTVYVSNPSVGVTANPGILICSGNSAQITATPSGGVFPYQYLWSNGATTQIVTLSNTGTFTVTITDSYGCPATASQTITMLQMLLTTSVNNVLCFGGNNGTISLSVSGGTAPYSYTWSDGSTNQNISGAAAGSYNVTVNDAGGCSVTALATIAQPIAGLALATTVANVSCFGGNNGTINLTISGGTVPYAFNWSNGSTIQNITNAVPGTYTVTVTDVNSCSGTISAIVTQPLSALLPTAIASNVSCFAGTNGAVNLSVSGGTSPYTFNWSNGSNTQNITNVSAGNYNVTVTDINGCSTNTSVSVMQPPALQVALTPTNPLCNGVASGQIVTQTTGGTQPIQYLWNTGDTSQNLSNAGTGTYTILVTDAHNCNTTSWASIIAPSAIAIAETHTNASCNGTGTGNINLNVNGGNAPYQYHWNTNSSTQNLSNIPAGNYSVTVTDANGCTASVGAITISQPASIAITMSITDAYCFASNTGSANTIISGGIAPYQYHWSNNSTTQNLTNVSAGNYILSVTDANGCIAVASAIIISSSPLVISESHINAICNGSSTGSINLNVIGGTAPYQYAWNNNSSQQNLSNITAGNYSVTVTDIRGCSASISAITISQPAAVSISFAVTDVACAGNNSGALSASISGGTGPYQFRWSNNTIGQNLSNVSAGNYSLTVTDANGCSGIASANILSATPISIAESHTNSSCNGANNGSVNLGVIGGTSPYQFSWSNNSSTQNQINLSAGTYSVTVTDANGCSSTLTAITISEPDVINLSLNPVNIGCSILPIGEVNATVSGGTSPYHYHWSNNSGNQNIANLAAGNYILTVTDANGCTQASSAPVLSFPPFTLSAVLPQLPCEEATGNINLTVAGGTPPFNYSWSNGTNTEDLSNIHPGNYNVTVTDSRGCLHDTSFTIINLHTFYVNATGGGTINVGQSVAIHATSTGSNYTTYFWTPSNYLPCPTCANNSFEPLQSELYTVTGTDTNGCKAQDTVSVEVIQNDLFFTPNAFSPNSDGNNDYFQLYGNLAGVNYVNVMIFDRWGEKLFESNEATFKWDGTYKGEKMPPAVYVYSLQLRHVDEIQAKVKKGSLTLIR